MKSYHLALIKKQLLSLGSTIYLVGAIFILSCFGCSKTDDVSPRIDLTNELQIIYPGNEIPFGTKVKIVESGIYRVPDGASIVTTRCFGTVTVSYTPTEGPTQSNTCQNHDGGSNQTNPIPGVDQIEFSLGQESYAEILLK